MLESLLERVHLDLLPPSEAGRSVLPLDTLDPEVLEGDSHVWIVEVHAAHALLAHAILAHQVMRVSAIRWLVFHTGYHDHSRTL